MNGFGVVGDGVDGDVGLGAEGCFGVLGLDGGGESGSSVMIAIVEGLKDRGRRTA